MSAEQRLRKEVFYLAYHLHWGHDEVMDMAIDDRWAYVLLLNEQTEMEREEIERAKKP